MNLNIFFLHFIFVCFTFGCSDFKSSNSSIENIDPPIDEFVIKIAPVDGTQDLININQALSEIKSSGKAGVLQLENGSYNLNCINLQHSYCIDINGFDKGLRIEGLGSSTNIIVKSPRSGFLFARNSKNLVFKNFIIDYDVPPITQGNITEVGSNYIIFQVDAGYLDFDDDLFAIDLFGPNGASKIGFIHNPGSHVMKRGGLNFLRLDQKPESLGDGLWKVTTTDLNLTSWINIGDGFSMGARSSHGFRLIENQNITIEDVKVYASPCLAFAVTANSGELLFKNIQVALKPGSGRKLSSVADALHFQDNAANALITGSLFQAMGDDAINTYSTGSKVELSSGYLPNELLISNARPHLYKVGHRLQILNVNRQVTRYDNLIINNVEHISANSLKIILNQDVELTQVTDEVYNYDLAIPQIEIQNNSFGFFRGIIRLRSAVANLTGNTFFDDRISVIYYGVDTVWDEGPLVQAPTTSLNIINQGRLKFLGRNYVLIEERDE